MRGAAPAGSASLAWATTLVPSSPQLLASGTASAWTPWPLLIDRAGSGRQENSPVVVAFHPIEHGGLRKGSSPPEPHQD